MEVVKHQIGVEALHRLPDGRLDAFRGLPGADIHHKWGRVLIWQKRREHSAADFAAYVGMLVVSGYSHDLGIDLYVAGALAEVVTNRILPLSKSSE